MYGIDFHLHTPKGQNKKYAYIDLELYPFCMPKAQTYVSWNTYKKILRVCAVLTKKEGKTVTPYKFIQRAILKALNEGL